MGINGIKFKKRIESSREQYIPTTWSMVYGNSFPIGAVCRYDCYGNTLIGLCYRILHIAGVVSTYDDLENLIKLENSTDISDSKGNLSIINRLLFQAYNKQQVFEVSILGSLFNVELKSNSFRNPISIVINNEIEIYFEYNSQLELKIIKKSKRYEIIFVLMTHKNIIENDLYQDIEGNYVKNVFKEEDEQELKRKDTDEGDCNQSEQLVEISNAFEKAYMVKSAAINIKRDLESIHIDEEHMRVITVNKNIFYQISNIEFVLLKWIIERIELEFTKGCEKISESKMEEIIRGITKTAKINRRLMMEIFFYNNLELSPTNFERIKEVLKMDGNMLHTIANSSNGIRICSKQPYEEPLVANSEKNRSGDSEFSKYKYPTCDNMEHYQYEKMLMRAFEEQRHIRGCFIDVYHDLHSSGISQDIIINIVNNRKTFLKVAYGRYVLLNWVIERVERELEQEKLISKFRMNQIVQEVAKLKRYDDSEVKKIFFSESNFLDSGDLVLVKQRLFEQNSIWVQKITEEILTEIPQSISNDGNPLSSKDPFNVGLNSTILSTGISDMNQEIKLAAVDLGDSFNGMYDRFCIFMKIKNQVRFDKLLIGHNTYDIRKFCNLTRCFCDSSLVQLLDECDLKKASFYRVASKNTPITSFMQAITEVSRDISDRDWDCLNRHVVLGNETLEEIGKKYKISRERVRQIISKTERKLRKHSNFLVQYYICLSEVFTFTNVFSIKDINRYMHGLPENIDEMIKALNIINLVFEDHFFILEGYVYRISSEKFIEEISGLGQNTNNGLMIMKKTLKSAMVNLGYSFSNINDALILIGKHKRVLSSPEKEYVFIKDSKPTNVDIAKWILFNIGRPVHYSIVLEHYIKFTGEMNYPARNILATLDRSEEAGIVRTFTGTYGLVDLGAIKHIAAEDIAEDILRTKGRPMHYSEIISLAREQTDAKENTIYAFLNISEKFISNNDGVYALLEWENSLDPSYQQKREVERVLISHGYNVFSRYALEYQIGDSMFKYGTLRFPSNMPLEVEPVVKIIDCNNEEYSLKYDVKYNYINRIDTVLNLKGIRLGERIWIELFSADTVRLFNEEEYKSYLKGEIVFDESKSNTNVESDHVDDILNIFFKEE